MRFKLLHAPLASAVCHHRLTSPLSVAASPIVRQVHHTPPAGDRDVMEAAGHLGPSLAVPSTGHFSAAMRYREVVGLARAFQYRGHAPMTVYRKMTDAEFAALRARSYPIDPADAPESPHMQWYSGRIQSKMGLLSDGDESPRSLLYETVLYRRMLHCQQGSLSADTLPDVHKRTPWISWSTDLYITNQYSAMASIPSLHDLPIVKTTVPRHILFRGNRMDAEWLMRGGQQITWRQVSRAELAQRPFPAKGVLAADGRPTVDRMTYIPGLGINVSFPFYGPLHTWPSFPPPPHVHAWHVTPIKS